MMNSLPNPNPRAETLDRPAVKGDQALHQGQTDSESALGAIDRRVDLREHFEHAAQRLRLKTDAVVLDRHRDLVRTQLHAQRDPSAGIGVFGRVGQEVRQ